MQKTITLRNGKAIEYEILKYDKELGGTQTKYGLSREGNYWKQSFSEKHNGTPAKISIEREELPIEARKILGLDRKSIERKVGSEFSIVGM